MKDITEEIHVQPRTIFGYMTATLATFFIASDVKPKAGDTPALVR
jgi:hypothetical protein